MKKLLTILTIGLLAVLFAAAPAFSEHSAAHVEKETAVANYAERQVDSGAWTVAQACEYSGFYMQRHLKACMSLPTATASPTANQGYDCAAAAVNVNGRCVPAAEYFGYAESSDTATASPTATATATAEQPASVLPSTGGPGSGSAALLAALLLPISGWLAFRLLRR